MKLNLRSRPWRHPQSLHSHGVQPPLFVGEHFTVVTPRTKALTEGGRQGQGTSELNTYKCRQCAVLVFAHSLLPEGTWGLMLFFSPSWKICLLGIKQTTGTLHTVNYRVKPTADEDFLGHTEHVRCCELQRLACGPGEGAAFLTCHAGSC